MTEAVRAMVHYGLFDVGFNRVQAYHSVNNPASGSVMRKVGMTYEGMARQKYRNANGFQDCDLYGILKGDLFQPAPFSGFYDAALPDDGELNLICLRERPSDPVTGYVPDYLFEMRVASERIGNISLRIGMCDSLYYGGQIGYGVEEAHRGCGYAGRACKLLLPLIRWHGYQQILITNNHTNQSSRRVCEKLGANMVRVAELPDWHELYQAGQRYECIWIWDVEEGEI